MTMELDKILKRQLSRLELSEKKLPTTLAEWQKFIERVNQRYLESDQERYLLERSMNISSKEMQTLNNRLMEAQNLAQLGYWHTNLINNTTSWSRELYSILNLDPLQPPLMLTDLFNLVVDKEELINKYNNSLATGDEFEAEFQLKDAANQMKCYRIIAHPRRNVDGIITEISGVMLDISKQKETEKNIEDMHQQLLVTARKAGMSDVATAMLHNVGNILNSVNVSITLIHENLNNELLNKLQSISKLIQTNQPNLGEYLTQSPQGKLLPDYLIALTNKFIENYKLVCTELELLKEKIEHIKQITASQKCISGVGMVIEKVIVAEVVQSAIAMCVKELELRDIHVVVNLNNKVFIDTDRSKLMQILINLIQNAKDALIMAKTNLYKQITIDLNPCAKNSKCQDCVEISVKDNGIGISEEAIPKIFAFGFTTKENGHGFGLHSSAIAAKELGGALAVKSAGLNQGAEFILTLPLKTHVRRKENESESKSTNYYY